MVVHLRRQDIHKAWYDLLAYSVCIEWSWRIVRFACLIHHGSRLCLSPFFAAPASLLAAAWEASDQLSCLNIAYNGMCLRAIHMHLK